MLTHQYFWAIFSLIMAVVQYVPYYYGMWQGRVKPHIFSWLIWVLPVSIGFVAQTLRGAGPGAWVSALSAILTLSVFLLALKSGDKGFSILDWVTLSLALLAIALWVITDDPLVAVIFSSIANCLGFVPTARKCQIDPYSESLFSYVASIIKWMCSMFALKDLNAVTTMTPLCSILSGAAFVAFVLVRRKRVAVAV